MRSFNYLFGSTDGGKTWKLCGSYESHAKAYEEMKRFRSRQPNIIFKIE